MPASGVNPYQPVVLDDSQQTSDDVACEVGFRLTPGLLRHAEAQYMLHWHPVRLLLGSLAMIAASCFAFWWSLPRGTIVFMTTLAATMSLSAIIYLALVHRTKRQVRIGQRQLGCVPGAVCTVTLDQQFLRMKSPAGAFQWPAASLASYRTRRGMLLCPQPLLFIFVPRPSDSSREGFDLLRRRIAS